MTPDDVFLPKRVQERLATGAFGRRMYFLREVDSTNRLAAELARLGESEGTIVSTDHQTRGRGRRDHHWYSPPSANLLFSLILRPVQPPPDVLPLTLAFAVAIADLLGDRLSTDVSVKWPNDVVTPQGKLCGILAESSTHGDHLDHVVIGFGINVNMKPQKFPDGTDGVSCASLTGRPHDRTELFVAVLTFLTSMYERFCASGFGQIAPHYNTRLILRDKEVAFRRGGKRQSGHVIGVHHDGALAVRSAGKILGLYDEEITVL